MIRIDKLIFYDRAYITGIRLNWFLLQKKDKYCETPWTCGWSSGIYNELTAI